MNINIIDFHRWEIEEMIPAYGDTIDEIIRYILTDWLTKNGHAAQLYNDEVKRLMNLPSNQK